MKVSRLTNIINTAFNFVILTSKNYNIDESHSLKHSIEVFNIANQIYNTEVTKNTFLENQKEIVQVSAILHDMCDKKYMDERIGVENINNAMKKYMSNQQLDVVSNIISTMSYSKVKKNGYPDLGEYQLAYHIVREADLLSAYDVDRCLIYQMMHEKYNYVDSLNYVVDLFTNRVLKYREDNLFETIYSKDKSLILHNKAEKDIENLIKIHNTFL
jgi:HD superfamily phosphodiesterase